MDSLNKDIGTHFLKSNYQKRNSVTPRTYFHLPRRGNQSHWEKKCNDLEAVVVQLQARLSAVEQQIPYTPESEHVSSNILRSGYEANFQPDFLLTENRVRTKDDIPPQALTQKILKSKCSNTLKSGDRGNFQHDSLLAKNMVRTKEDIPPQDHKQNKRKGKPCKLAIGSIENIVAHGTVYERIEHNEAIHTVPLGESNRDISNQTSLHHRCNIDIDMGSRRSLCLLVVVVLMGWSEAYQFNVGGKEGWVLNPSENYNHWAGRMRLFMSSSSESSSSASEQSSSNSSSSDETHATLKMRVIPDPPASWHPPGSLPTASRSGSTSHGSVSAEYTCKLKKMAKHLKDLLSSDQISSFRHHFSIPDDVRLSLVTDGTLDMERPDETTIVFPLLSIAEGGV
ncbi:hypothetical protein TEA_015958 [Camellia sinensis var. sinensis]|uniref:Uncharacterized protein n=1 Tax=Camellia sinensis var. sinensis TaxID=542762 RepID=A0A4S4F369_CAMSN|nr:hypothetical protein TEA_015958 [Camellia sinensis var. sinensis]